VITNLWPVNHAPDGGNEKHTQHCGWRAVTHRIGQQLQLKLELRPVPIAVRENKASPVGEYRESIGDVGSRHPTDERLRRMNTVGTPGNRYRRSPANTRHAWDASRLVFLREDRASWLPQHRWPLAHRLTALAGFVHLGERCPQSPLTSRASPLGAPGSPCRQRCPLGPRGISRRRRPDEDRRRVSPQWLCIVPASESPQAVNRSMGGHDYGETCPLLVTACCAR